MVPAGGGVLSTGDFALHARAIFASRAPTFTWVGPGSEDGRKTIQFDFRVPRQKSAYRIRTGAHAGVVGYHGSFWVEAATLDLVRIQVQVDDIPADLSISQVEDMLEYQRVRIGDADFLLPRASELIMVDAAESASRNRTRFSSCRQYSGQSVVRFTDAAAPEQPVERTRIISLPANTGFLIELAAEVRGVDLAVGDAVLGKLARDAKNGADVLFPKGAAVTGHVTRAQKRRANFGDFWVLGIQFSRIESPGRQAEFQAALEDLFVTGTQFSLPFGFHAGSVSPAWARLTQPVPPPSPGEGVIFVRGGQFRMPAGVLMLWRTTGGQP
jgi:hypothetical protein